MFLLFTLVLFTLSFAHTAMGYIAKPGCQKQCGDLEVPYPFGIGKECSLDKSFNLACDMMNHKAPKLFIGTTNMEIYSILGYEMRISNTVAYKCYNESGDIIVDHNVMIDLEKTPFTFSQKNKFTVIGCDDDGRIRWKARSYHISGCAGLCSNQSQVPNGYCSGIGCCQTSIPKGLKHLNVSLDSFNNHINVSSFNRCGFAFLTDERDFRFGGARDLSNVMADSFVPIVVDWVIGGNQNCSQDRKCKENSLCQDEETGGYRCGCKKGYQGNPYLDPGCLDINECEDSCTFPCFGICANTPGSYNCTCLKGYTGDPTTKDGCQKDSAAAGNPKFLALEISLALVFGLLTIFSGITGICFGIRKRNLMKLREKFFLQNGGVFLQQKLNAPGATDTTVTMFSTQQLRKSTDDYSEERIVGRGGYGVVYKGILPDERIVAIKKSKLVDATQSEQFINEILILTQVIHRNVVKLLGCCLEEEVPVLVYEFISNNTLYYHLHHKSGGMSWLSWENRLRVASEAASALAYLHSQATMPIIHRDVKSANILLDENYTTKISDFGASRLVPLDHDQVTTLVQGTLGYLDPEYFHTSQLTGKSDVYSFGVVLAELITGQKPLSAFRIDEDKNLATYFVKSMEENRLFEIVEPRVLREGTVEQLQEVAELIRRCVSLEGKNRPTMKDVAMELEGLRKFTTHPWVQQQTSEESRSLMLEVEQSDLYAVPLIPSSSNEWESYSGMSEMTFQENNTG